MKTHWLIEYLENELPKEMSNQMKEYLRTNPTDQKFIEQLSIVKEDLRLYSNEKVDMIFQGREDRLFNRIMKNIDNVGVKKSNIKTSLVRLYELMNNK
jgi:hypothetical protein